MIWFEQRVFDSGGLVFWVLLQILYRCNTQQGDVMAKSTQTTDIDETIVFPARHNLQIPDNDWGWCRLDDAIQSIRNIARRSIKDPHTNFNDMRPVEIIQRFAALVKMREVSDPDKFFYCRDGFTLQHVSIDHLDQLAIGGIYVPEGWVKSVTKVVEAGGHRVFYGRLLCPGYPSSDCDTLLYSCPDKEGLFTVSDLF